MKPCPKCDGSGLGHCLTCRGTGCSICMVEDDPIEYEACEMCDGTGRVPVTEADLEAAGQLNMLESAS